MILVAATFVAEPVGAPLELLLRACGIEDAVTFAPYHQVFQQLLTPGSELHRNACGIPVLLIRLEDFVRGETDLAQASRTVHRLAEELGDALAFFKRACPGPTVLAVLSDRDPTDPLGQALVEASDVLARRSRDLPGISVVLNEDIGRTESDHRDPSGDRLAHIPYTDEHYAAIALTVARRVHRLLVPPGKVLVLDCDNTIWHGVVGEDGLDGIEITSDCAAIQEFAIVQQSRGALICLASKNAERDVLDVLERRQDMRLRPEHIIAHRINWNSKSANLRSLAEELGLGLDAFVFLDDNPLECAQVRAELPQVVTIEVPEAGRVQSMLRNLWVFDKSGVTVEDRRRTELYRQNLARQALENSSSDIGAFLASLELKIDVAEPTLEEWPRIEQLLQRTNQFNFTTRRHSVAALQSLRDIGYCAERVCVKDRFGDYGLVGFLLVDIRHSELVIDTFLLSCRVLGRGVEHAMLRRIGQMAAAADAGTVLLPYLATSRNRPARAFADSVAEAYAEVAGPNATFRIPTAVACEVTHHPGADPKEILQARDAADRTSQTSGSIPVVSGRSEAYQRLATVLAEPRALLSEVARAARHERGRTNPVAPPANALESGLVALWERLLNHRPIGVTDDFFELGGTSLLSVRLFTEIERQWRTELPLSAILKAPTVRLLARLIATRDAEKEGGCLVRLRKGGTRNLFLVHDGFGETLLYRNLAQRLPTAISIYGLVPRTLPGIPMAHSSLEEMAAFYVEQMRSVQPRGPYWIGGMCAGGVIAYQMAVRLVMLNEVVHGVIILDGAHPRAAKRRGRVASMRRDRIAAAMAAMNTRKDSTIFSWAQTALLIARKARNAAIYEVSARLERISVALRHRVLKNRVDRKRGWPRWLPELTVSQIYAALESHYLPPVLAGVPVLLVRAERGEGPDTPYRNIYREDDFGWASCAFRLEVVDVRGGHSSMLQEPDVEHLSALIGSRIASHSSRTAELV